jgi:hypothetical protein
MERFMIYTGKSIYGLVLASPYYGSMWQKTAIARQRLIEASYLEILRNGLGYT